MRNTFRIVVLFLLCVTTTISGMAQQIAPLPIGTYLRGVDASSIARNLIGIDRTTNAVKIDPDGRGTSFGGTVTMSSTTLAPDGTAAAPSISFTNTTNKGFFNPSSSGNNIGYSANGTFQAVLGANAMIGISSYTYDWSSSGSDPTTGLDTLMGRIGAGVIKIGNASQTFNNEGSIGDATHTLKDVFLNGNAGGNATAGSIGELVTSTVTSGALVNLATGSATTITSITLTAGDWDVDGTVYYRLNAATSVTILAQASNSVGTGILDTQEGARTTFETAANVMTANADPSFNIPTTRYSLSTTKIIYLASNAVFTVNTAQAYGVIRARRVR